MQDILAIGIDLGTTNSVVARINEQSVAEVIPNSERSSLTPSVVHIHGGQTVVGADAKEAMAEGTPDTAAFFKRNMGDARFRYYLDGKEYTAVELSAMVLKKLKRDAEAQLKRSITHAVITVPAYFTDPQRNATIEAANLAGLQVLEIINEPTAAAFAYGLHDTGREETILVYDLGGGTFDVTVVRLTRELFTAIATAGDHQLGGKDWDDAIARFLLEKFRDEFGVDPMREGLPYGEVLVLAESAKRTLSGVETTQITLNHGGHRLQLELSREEFELKTAHLMETTRSLCDQVLRDASLSWDKLTGVLLVGGSTRMPMAAQYAREMSGREPLTGINQDHAVAIGAAIRAARCLDERTPETPRFRLPGPKRIQDIISHPLGMIAESSDGNRYINSVIINKNLPIPCVEGRPFQLYTQPGNDNQMEVYITQGESTEPAECKVIARWSADHIEHGADDLQIIDVSYAYTKNGIVEVSAKARSSGRAVEMRKEVELGDLGWMSLPPARPPGTGRHVTAYLAIDLSYSMHGSGLKTARQAALEFVRQTDLTKCSIGLVEFADKVRITCEACQNARELENRISETEKNLESGVVGFGNEASPFSTTQASLQAVDGPRFIIVLTDGIWNNQAAAIIEAQSCREAGIEIIAVGTEASDKAFLTKIASSEASSFYTQQNQVVGIFSSIARELTETAGGSKRGLRLK